MFTFALVKQNNGAIAQLVKKRPGKLFFPRFDSWWHHFEEKQRQ